MEKKSLLQGALFLPVQALAAVLFVLIYIAVAPYALLVGWWDDTKELRESH